jgi:hypothetical protein
MSVLSSFENLFKLVLNMNEKCNDRYTFQTNRIPSWTADLIFKYQNTMNALLNVFWVVFLPGQAHHLT